MSHQLFANLGKHGNLKSKSANVFYMSDMYVYSFIVVVRVSVKNWDLSKALLTRRLNFMLVSWRRSENEFHENPFPQNGSTSLPTIDGKIE